MEPNSRTATIATDAVVDEAPAPDTTLEEIEARWARATRGPYGYDLNGYVAVVLPNDEEWGPSIAKLLPVNGPFQHCDGELLAHSWSDIRFLLDTVRAERARSQFLYEALINVRDILIPLQKEVGWLPEQQAYSTVMTKGELAICQAIKDLTSILNQASELEQLKGTK